MRQLLLVILVILMGVASSWSAEVIIKASDVQASDFFGWSVSISGDYAIVGAYGEDTGGNMAGAAYIFNRSEENWTQQAKIQASDIQGGDQFGYSVSISGDYAIAGSHGEDTGSSAAGAAYIFYRSGTSWSQQAKIMATDAEENDEFGFSVSISGDYAIVGTFSEDTGGSGAGAAYIFYRSGTSWSQQAKIMASDAGTYNFFGDAVTISGDYALVGAPYEDTGGDYAGAVYIFNRSGTNWTQQAKIMASDVQYQDEFGCSVSISGDYVIVGAHYEDTAASNAGAVYSYLRNGVTWSQKAKITASDAEAADLFGHSVSISGDYAIVGAYGEDTGGSYAGAAYIYKSIDDFLLPVNLSTFTAQFISNTPTLFWTTQSETNNLGWNIYRSETEEFEEAIQINTELIPGAGTTTEPTEYIYEDEHEIEYGETYWYWLESMGISGLTETYGPISLLIQEEGDEPESPDLPKIYGLHQNYPNPFNPDTEISFMMKEDCVGELSIFNIKGEMVRTIFTNQSIPRDELVVYYWDGKSEGGKVVTSGVYYYKLITTKGNYIRKMILIK